MYEYIVDENEPVAIFANNSIMAFGWYSFFVLKILKRAEGEMDVQFVG